MTVLGGREDRVAVRLTRHLEMHVRRFVGVTEGARGRFEKRRWSEQRSAQGQRTAMRERAIAAAAREVRAHHGFDRSWALPWDEFCDELRREVEGEHLRTWARAFGACVAHRLGVREVVTAPLLQGTDSIEVLRRCIGVVPCRGTPVAAARELLGSAGLRAPWRGFDQDVAACAACLAGDGEAAEVELLVHIEPAFRGECCYLLAVRCRDDRIPAPFLIELAHGPSGVQLRRVIDDPEIVREVLDPAGEPLMVATLHPDATTAFLRVACPSLSPEASFRVIGLGEIGDELLRRCITSHLMKSGAHLEFAQPGHESASVVLEVSNTDVELAVAGRRLAGAHQLDALVLPRDAFAPAVLPTLRAIHGVLIDAEGDDPVILRHVSCRCAVRW